MRVNLGLCDQTPASVHCKYGALGSVGFQPATAGMLPAIVGCVPGRDAGDSGLEARAPRAHLIRLRCCFLEQIEGLTFWEALKQLAEENGIPIPVSRGVVDKETDLREALFAMHETAAQVFQANLRGPNGAVARDYLIKRGLTPAIAEQFGIGYSDRAGQDLVKRFANYGPAELEASGLVRKRNEGTGYYDVFRDRLMFPIRC